MKRYFLLQKRSLLVLLLFTHSLLWSNSIQVSEISLSNQNPNTQSILVEFDISWENSWRISAGPANWDAAWVFIKFRVGENEWQHASLNYVNGTAAADGHSAPNGATITTPADGVGAFLYRSTDGSGTVNWKDVQLRWNYGLDGVGIGDQLDVDVFAIEMVYVPEGSFTVGGGGVSTEVGKFYKPEGVFQAIGYSIESEGVIPVASSGNALYYNAPADENAGDQNGPIPVTFPKGYAAFYCMKYEVSQHQWISFFNMLTPDQKANHDLTDLDHRGPNETDRNSIHWIEPGGASTEHPFVPVTFTLWGDIMAYMDWAGLRPMTELEYVKACRGPLPPVANGYAWGTTNIISTDHTYDLLNKRSEEELLENPLSHTGNANTLYASIFEDGPYRCGIFAASAKESRREDTGGSFYGIMEMTGNVSEMAVTVGTAEGRAFRAIHGNGSLTIDGKANVPFWPPETGEGGGLFGGSWFSLLESLRINDRRNATIGNVGYFNDVGFRCVRTAP